jgi:hypothetical protein
MQVGCRGVSLVAALTADERAVVVVIVLVADTIPLTTALFFAFLITLVIWLYDVYKPMYDVRFTVAPIA